MDDSTLLEQFQSRELPFGQWCHRLHVRVAYLHLRKQSFDAALKQFRSEVRAYNDAHRVPDELRSGYHETLTCAWLHVIASRMRTRPEAADSDSFCNANADLLEKTLLRQFYSSERIASWEAKHEFVEPDLQALPTAHSRGETMPPTISMITLGVSDLLRSIQFYERLGFVRVPYEPETIAFFEAGGTQLALFPKDELAEDARVSGAGDGFCGVTLAQAMTSSADVDAALASAVAAGATLTKAGEATAWGGYSGYFADPDGYLWEMACSSILYSKERKGDDT